MRIVLRAIGGRGSFFKGQTKSGAWLAFFAGFAFLGLRAPLGFEASGAGLLIFSLSIAFSLIEFLLDRVAVVTVITPVMRNIKWNLRAMELMRRMPLSVRGIGGCGPLF